MVEVLGGVNLTSCLNTLRQLKLDPRGVCFAVALSKALCEMTKWIE